VPEGLNVLPVSGLPEVVPGDDLAALIVSGVTAAGLDVVDGDVLVVSSKVASKAFGLVEADREAAVVAATRRVVAERALDDGRVTRVVESAAGPVMAAAGVDASNTGALDGVLLLPEDPDGVCVSLLERLRLAFEVQRLAVVLSDTSGRPWRMGQIDFALGAAGLFVIDDLRESSDADGRTLSVTTRAIADEIAAAADLVKGKAARVPVAVVRGVGEFVTGSVGDQGGRSLVRTGPEDWFATGAAEAVRAALGVAPGSELAERVGIPSIAEEPAALRVRRAVAVALAGQALGEGVGVDVGKDALVVTGGDPVDQGILAARIGMALWGEGFTSSVDPSPARGAGQVTVRILPR
jgi:coenzyme F420-0:L-glutamate ligase/coenzyme F420-1:gamma-L-glutamate ligase